MRLLFYAILTVVFKAATLVCFLWTFGSFFWFLSYDATFNWWAVVLTVICFVLWLSFFAALEFQKAADNYDEYKTTRGPKVKNN